MKYKYTDGKQKETQMGKCQTHICTDVQYTATYTETKLYFHVSIYFFQCIDNICIRIVYIVIFKLTQ